MLRLKRLWLFLLVLGMGLWLTPRYALSAYACHCQSICVAHSADTAVLADAGAEEEYCVPRRPPSTEKPCPVVCSQFEQPAHLEKAAPPVQSPETLQAMVLSYSIQALADFRRPCAAPPSGLPAGWALPTSPPIASQHLNLPPPPLA